MTKPRIGLMVVVVTAIGFHLAPGEPETSRLIHAALGVLFLGAVLWPIILLLAFERTTLFPQQPLGERMLKVERSESPNAKTPFDSTPRASSNSGRVAARITDGGQP